MYENHPKISLNNYSDSQIIWRYMDFTKFLSLLQFSSLFFCTCSQMQNMDPLEGDYPKKNKEKLTTSKEIIKLPSEYRQKPRSYRTKFLQNIGINCWHANNSENAAMWKVYLSSKEGIAIKTTIRKLKKSFENNAEDTIYIGAISYNDYDFNSIEMNYNNYLSEVINLAKKEKQNNKKITDADILNELAAHYYPLIMSKRREFSYGQEIRAISPINPKTRNKRVKDEGKLVKTNLEKLVDEIIISPSADNWFVDLVKETVKSYDLKNKKVYKSKIYEKINT